MFIMKVRQFIVFLIVFILLLSNPGLSKREFNVGVSPSIVDLGDVESGTSQIVEFFIITPSEEALLVNLEPVRGKLDFFNRAAYKDFIYNSSEQDTTGWVKIFENPVELKSDNESFSTGAGIIRGSREISFVLDIPQNSDPGYHSLTIRPTPLVSPEEMGTVGTMIVAITTVNIVFNVSGNAIREGVILDVRKGDYIGKNLEINTYFQNTGTTTISARVKQSIYDENSGLVGEFFSSSSYFNPSEIKPLKTYLPVSGLVLGDYETRTTVEYTTGSASKNSTVTISEIPPTAEDFVIFVPFWLIFLIIILVILIIVYRRIK